jgi:hypothetical protein
MAYLSGYNILFDTTDSVVYKEFYESLDVNDPFVQPLFEYGFVFLAYIGKSVLKLGYYHWVTIINLCSLSIKFWIFSRHRNYLLIAAVYIFILFPFYECLVVRAALGYAIALFGLEYFYSKKIKFLIFVLLASLVHISMILFLLPLLFFKFEKTGIKPFWVFFGLISLIVLKQFLIFLLEFYPRISPYYYENPKYFNIWGIPRVIVLLLGWFYLFRKLKSKYEIILSNIIILLTVFAVVSFEFSLFSIRIIDLILPLFFILIIQNIKAFRLFGYYLLLFSIFELFFVRIIDGAVHTTNLLKWLG